MSHDYAKRKKTTPAKKRRSELPAWFWVLTGVATGLFIALLIFLSTYNRDNKYITYDKKAEQAQEKDLTKQIKEQAERLREGKEALKKPTFEFYQRLPEMTVETPRPAQRATEIQSTKSYVLQAGSFRSFHDADALKAQLIMQGLDVQIQSVQNQQGQTWHRVQVGPYDNQRQLNRAQDVLAENNIASILMEVK